MMVSQEVRKASFKFQLVNILSHAHDSSSSSPFPPHRKDEKVKLFRGIRKQIGRTRQATSVLQFNAMRKVQFSVCSLHLFHNMNNFWTKLLLIVWECECEFHMKTIEKCFLCAQLKLLHPASHICGLISPHEAYISPANEKTKSEAKLVEFQRASNFCFANVLIMNVCVCVRFFATMNKIEQNGNVWKCRILFTTAMTTKDVPTWAATKRKQWERNEQTTKFGNLFRCGFDAWQLHVVRFVYF